MAFKIKPFYTLDNAPIVHVPMEKNVMGRADKKGNILINKDLKHIVSNIKWEPTKPLSVCFTHKIDA